MLEERMQSLAGEYSKEEWDKAQTRLMVLQQKMRTAKLPVVVIFEGLCGSGRTSCVSALMQSMDPRGFDVYSYYNDADDPSLPFIVPFARLMPKYGDMTVFNPSCYTETFLRVGKKYFDACTDTINGMERLLCNDGYLVVKFFMHISQKTQKKRLSEKSSKELHIPENTLADAKSYDKNMRRFEKLIAATDSEFAGWIIINGEDRKKARLMTANILADSIERALDEKTAGAAARLDYKYRFNVLPHRKISDISLDQGMEETVYNERLDALRGRLGELSNRLYDEKIPLIIAYEGNDAAGKGGSIKRVARALDPRLYRVVPISAPSSDELNHHYLWRFINNLPKKGNITIFDRTWYGRVLVENVEGLTPVERVEQAYAEINGFEKLLTATGAVLVKFWLAIDKEEQLVRFEARQNTPEKQWKITDEDWRNRDKWDAYAQAVDTMIAKTNTDYAPWTVVESNCKRFGRIKALETIIAAAEQKLKTIKK